MKNMKKPTTFFGFTVGIVLGGYCGWIYGLFDQPDEVGIVACVIIGTAFGALLLLAEIRGEPASPKLRPKMWHIVPDGFGGYYVNRGGVDGRSCAWEPDVATATQRAITLAEEGDTVILPAGVIEWSRAVNLTKSVSIRGA